MVVNNNDMPKDMDPTEEEMKQTEETEATESTENELAEEKQQMHLLGMGKLALDILPILDNFERALATDDVKDEKFYEGMKMIADQFRDELAKNDIVEIDALNAPFDPNLHHAVMIEEKEGVEADVVIDVLQKGYKLKDRVIRPAMVKVSK